MSSPAVSVILPTLNERRYIRDCLDSLIAQDYQSVVEILVVDGGSTDGTRTIVGSQGHPVRLLDNPRITAAAGMNVGLRQARGDVLCRADAHSRYASDYVRRCVEVLLETGADNVGGVMRPVGTTSFGRAVAAVTCSPIGIGGGRFHFSEARAAVDTVYLGCWWRTTLEGLGGYDETRLQWAAEDQELNFRIRRAGGRVLLDPSIRSWYFPRETPRSLARQYFNYGMAKASTLAKHGSLPTWRPLAPAALVGTSVAGMAVGNRWTRLAVPLLHTVSCAVAATRLGRKPGVSTRSVFGALEICHWSYGLGFLNGVARIVRGRRFDTRPTGHR